MILGRLLVTIILWLMRGGTGLPASGFFCVEVVQDLP